MRITDVEALHIRYPLPKDFRPAWHPGETMKEFDFVIVKVHTDADIVGVGCGGDSCIEVKVSVERLKQCLIGIDPFSVERIARLLDNSAYEYGPSLGCVEIAFWDIIGKACGEPVSRLLGGYQNRVKAYASTGECKSAETIVKEVESYVNEGFKAVKLKFHNPNPLEDIRLVQAIRDTVGDKIEILADANQSAPPSEPYWTYEMALKIARRLEKLDVVFLEEPLFIEDHEGLSKLASAVDIPIAGGENERRVHRFRQLLEKGCFDIVQPDVVYTGVLNAKKIASLAEAYNRLCVPHTWNSGGLGLLANLQLVCAISNCPYLEYPYDKSGWTIEARDALLKEPVPIKDGYVDVPSKPGLGIDLNEEAVQRYLVS